MCDTYGRSVHAPHGVERPGGLELAPPGSHPFTAGVAAPYLKTASPSTLCAAVVRISTLFGERQQRQDHVLVLPAFERVTDQIRDTPDEADDFAMVHDLNSSTCNSQRIVPGT